MRGRILIGLVAFLCLAGFTWAAPAEETPLLAHQPTLSRTQIVFVYGGDLLGDGREGWEGRWVINGGAEGVSTFFPGGEWIMFAGGVGWRRGVVFISAGGRE